MGPSAVKRIASGRTSTLVPGWPTSAPGSVFARPTNRATNTVAGRSYSSSAVPTCSRRPAFRTATRSPRSNASSCSCVTKTVVIPTRLIASRSSRRVRSRSAGSRFESGSSSNSTRGSGASERASATRCCCPPESSVTRRRSNPARSTRASASATCSARSPPATLRRPKATLPNTSRCGKSAYVWNTMPKRRRAGATRVISSPFTTIRPASGVSKPARIRSVVVFPLPDGPSSARISPLATSSERSDNARWPGKLLVSPRRERYPSPITHHLSPITSHAFPHSSHSDPNTSSSPHRVVPACPSPRPPRPCVRARHAPTRGASPPAGRAARAAVRLHARRAAVPRPSR